MESHDLAWAAGFFDGEGWANRQRRGVNSRINQASLDGVPEVLMKFRRLVGVGRIHGPVIVEGKQPLYYWDATSRPDLLHVVERIGPWLCPAKRAEFERTLGGPLPAQVWPGSMSEELAWAGGFFDGEGSTYLEKHRTHSGYFYPVLYVPQAAEIGIAPELLRLKAAMGGLGNISGVRQDGPEWTPYRRWRVVTPLKVQAALHLALAIHRRCQTHAGAAGHDDDPRSARPAARQSCIWSRRCALLPPGSRQVERSAAALQRARNTRAGPNEPSEAMSRVRS